MMYLTVQQLRASLHVFCEFDVSMKDISIPWFSPKTVGGELTRLQGVLERNFFNDGPLTQEFQDRIAGIAGTRYAVAVTSGTAAISLALMAAGVGAGDEVIVPDLTFIATANAVRLTGASVKLVDIEPRRFGISISALAAVVGPRTRAVVAVDVNGRGANYEELEAFCNGNCLALICDSAEALGSRYAARALGSFGLAGCFSFSAAKTVSTGQGGMITTNDEQVAARLAALKDQGRPVRGTGGDDAHPTLGFNFKYTDLQAAVGLAQLDALDQRLAKARQRDEWYRAALSGTPGLEFPDYDQQPQEVRQWTDVLLDRKHEVKSALEAASIGCRAFWHPLHTQPPYWTNGQACPNAADVSARGLWLPSHFDLTEEDVGRVADVIRKTLRG
jgi:perosamine synthetase